MANDQMNSNSIDTIVNQLMQAPGQVTTDETGWLQFSEELSEEKVMEQVRKYESQWKHYASQYEKKLENAYSMYKNQNLISEGTSTKVPEIFALIETELPHLLNAMFGQSQVIDAHAKFIDPGEDRTTKIKAYINNLIVKVCDGEKKTKDIIKNELIYGLSFIKVWWDNDYDWDINPLNGQLTKINSAHANFDLVDPFTLAWDTMNQSHNVQECEWIRERIFLTKNKMRVMRDNGECGWFEDDDMTATENKGRMKRQKQTGDYGPDEDGTYYDEYSCTLFEETPDGRMQECEYIVWVLSQNKIIKFFKNKMQRKMYAVCRAYDIPNEFMGLGEPDVVGALASHASYIWFQFGKAVKRVGQRMAVLTPDANLSPEQLRTVEDGIFFVDDAKGLSFQENDDSEDVENLMKAQESVEAKIGAVSGVTPALQGESIGDVTATEASYVFQNASNRLALKLESLQQDFMEKLAEMLFLLTKQTLQQPISFFDTNNNNKTITPADLLGNYDWEANGSIAQANKALQLAQNTQLAQQIIQLVGASQTTSTPLDFNGLEILKSLVAPYTNTPDLSRIVFPKPPPPPPMMPPVGPHTLQPGAPGQPNNAAGPIQSAGLTPEAIAHLPHNAQLNPQAQVPGKMPHIGNREEAVLKQAALKTP